MFDYNLWDAIVIPLTTVILIAAAVCLRFALKNAKPVYRTLPLKIIAVFVPLLEVAKQIYYNVFEDFTLYILPLHFCSLFFLFMPLSQFGFKKVREFFKPMTVIYALLVTILVYVNPHALIGNSASALFASFHNTHTFLYHFSVIAYFIFSVALGDYRPRYKHCINVSCGIAIYVSYAVPCAYLLNTNYVNILYSAFKPLEDFRLWAGQVAYNVVLFTISVAAVCLICVASCLIYKAVTKLPLKKNAEENP